MLRKNNINPRLLLVLFTILTSVTSLYAGRNLVTIETSLGDITVELYQDAAPNTVENFLGYVDSGFYEGLIFHRVIEDFMAQTGAYDPNLYEVDFSTYTEEDPYDIKDPNTYHEPGDPIELETDAGLKNLRGTIAMARTSAADSATSQFFINFVDNSFLDPGSGSSGYAVFGKVVDGMDIVDLMNGVENIADPDDDVTTNEYDHITGYFDDVPVDPITITRVYRVQNFEDDTSSVFEDVNFMKANDGAIRTFIGIGDNAPTTETDGIWSYEFSSEEYLGINCLKWHHNAQETNIPDKTYFMARDTDGDIFILKELNDEGTNSEQTLFEAEDLLEIRPISYYANTNMYFRLLDGSYDSDNLDADENKIVIGSGSSTETEQIIQFDGSLSPNYTNDDVIIVKFTRGLVGSESLTEYYYYHKDVGLILYLQDEDQDLEGDGWQLDNKIFDSTSNDFSNIPFMKLEQDFNFTRYYVGKGDIDKNYFYEIDYPSEKYNGVSYIQWIQTGISEEGIRNFEIHLAKDTNDELWVFYYEKDYEIIFEKESLIDAEKLETFANENILFSLISGTYNKDDLDDPANIINRVEYSTNINEKIVAFNETLPHIPHYQNGLVKVKRWEGDDNDENDNNIFYYHEDVGMVRNYRNGSSDSDGDGWEIANFGGLFKEDSGDLSDVDFLRVTDGSIKHYYGSNDLEEDNFAYEFTGITYSGKDALKFISAAEAGGTNAFEIQLGIDSMGTVWVFRYKIDGDNVFYPGSSATAFLYAKPLSDFADDNMHFKLISGQFDSTLPYDPDNAETEVNKIAYTLDSEEITEQIVSFNASLPDVPYYKDDLILVEYNNLTDPNDSVRWKYYHPEDGLVREVHGSNNEPADFENNSIYRLAWSSKAKPTFTNSSDDFSEVDFLYAKPGDIKLMTGIGLYEGQSYLIKYNRSLLLNTVCLEVTSDLTQFDTINTKESYYFARDPDLESLWILAHYVNDQPVFTTNYLDQAVPFERWPDIRWQMCAESKEVGDSVTSGDYTKTIIAEDAEFSERDDLDDELVVIKQNYDLESDPLASVSGYTYLHQGEGVVISLFDNFFDPDESDPNVDNPDDIVPNDADGFYQAAESGLDELEIKVKTSKNRDTDRISDRFTLTGEFDLSKAEFIGEPLTFVIGPWTTTIDTESSSFKEVKTDRYRYTGTVGDKGRISLYIDLRDGYDTFKLIGSRVDLSGLIEPIEISMVAGGEIYQNAATLIGNLPIYQLKNMFDSLEAYKYIRKWTDKRINDRLIITGGITSEEPVDLTDIDSLEISWGTSASQTLDANDFKQSGKRNRFYLRSPDSPLRELIIDWDKAYFKAYFMKNSLSAPSKNLTITITDNDDNIIFDQTTTVN